jgi:hypothetical protein
MSEIISTSISMVPTLEQFESHSISNIDDGLFSINPDNNVKSAPTKKTLSDNIWSKVPMSSPPIWETTSTLITYYKSTGEFKSDDDGVFRIPCPFSGKFLINDDFQPIEKKSGIVDVWTYISTHDNVEYKLRIKNS